MLVSRSLALLVTQLTCYLHFGQDILKSPVIILLNEEATARKVPCWLDPQRPESQLPVDTETFNKRWPCKADHICSIDSLIITPIYVYFAFSCRFLWYHKWASETSVSLQTLQQSNGSIVGVPSAKGLYLPTPNTQKNKRNTDSIFLFPLVCLLLTYKFFWAEYADIVHNVKHRQNEIELNDRLQLFWVSLERICGAANFASTVKHGKKNQKKTALSNLFKTLEECGLSKHRPMGHEVL